MPRASATRSSNRHLWPFLGLCFLFLAACESAIDVRIDVAEDGSGTVRVVAELDQEATAAILDLDSIGLALSDLEQSGWRLEPPARLETGGLELTASKAFGTPDQLAEVLVEITGEAGLLSDFALVRTKEFARVDYQLSGFLRPNGFEVFGDQALTDALGRSIESFAQRYSADPADVTVTIRVELPGTPRDIETATGETPSDEAGTVREWSTTLADVDATQIRFGSTTQTVAALVWRGVAIVAAVLAALVLLAQLLGVLRPQTRRGRKATKAKPKPKPRAVPVIPAEEAIIEEGEVQTTPVVVALDGMGVIYREGNDIHEILIPFAREMGSVVTEDEIVAKARSLSLGRLTPGDFWQSLGIEGDANELDDLYLSRHQLTPGVIKFLRTLRDQGVQVACITNDATAWANKLRTRHSLEGLIDPWVMSGAVGVRKPDAPIFEVLRRVTGQPPALIMVVDDELEMLDAARDLGYRTAWFNPEGSLDEANGHAILRSFDVQTPDSASASSSQTPA